MNEPHAYRQTRKPHAGSVTLHYAGLASSVTAMAVRKGLFWRYGRVRMIVVRCAHPYSAAWALFCPRANGITSTLRNHCFANAMYFFTNASF